MKFIDLLAKCKNFVKAMIHAGILCIVAYTCFFNEKMDSIEFVGYFYIIGSF